MSIKEFFGKLFRNNNDLEYKEPNYKIEIISCNEISESGEVVTSISGLKPRTDKILLVECLVDGTSGKYLHFGHDLVINYDSLIVPRDHKFMRALTQELNTLNMEHDNTQRDAFFAKRARKIKEAIEAKKTLSATPASSPSVKIDPKLASVVLPKKKLSDSEMVDKLVYKTIQDISSQETIKFEETDKPVAPKKKGGRPKKEVV